MGLGGEVKDQDQGEHRIQNAQLSRIILHRAFGFLYQLGTVIDVHYYLQND